ncbi:hypothetical protein SNE25_31690 [Mucilaginibacter sabulilitoris]|uniref:GLPGLI family protein n=1 Tax=Mucilaginibacter sabulilitoris TaxID=1173583 RepID=A0ABZ0TL27_9SPHI|nr:hypothetical protein [Mucilaginibacter sabulilitoris]WPU93881.1 hypothetical protein SNE25_31690 [Mucilaginibacter sabulilitoris]
MKTIKLIVIFCCCLTSAHLFAQNSPQSIESDLLRILKRVNYYGAHKKDWKAIDSLQKQNKIFAFKLKYYTSKYPETISQPFTSLVKERLVIATSADGIFRTYSWNTQLGTKGFDIYNVLQYKNNGQTISLLKMDTIGKKGYMPLWYSKIFTFTANNKTYYLTTYNSVYSPAKVGQGLKVFTIDKGKLIGNPPFIKTPTGVYSQLHYDFDVSSIADWKSYPAIYFDKTAQTIHTPLVDYNHKMTHKLITYKFTGRFFEKLK